MSVSFGADLIIGGDILVTLKSSVKVIVIRTGPVEKPLLALLTKTMTEKNDFQQTVINHIQGSQDV